MNNTSSLSVRKNLFLLAKLFQQLEQSVAPVDADQYRAVAGRLMAELDATPRNAALDALLNAFPAAAELYENANYQYAGLCRSPLDASTSTEAAARDAINLARRHTTASR